MGFSNYNDFEKSKYKLKVFSKLKLFLKFAAAKWWM